jgi:hypothetical protein
MSVKDDALTAVHAALLAVHNEVAAGTTRLTAAQTVVTTEAAALTQNKALADALATMHAVGTGVTAAAPVVATAWTTVKKWAMPAGAGAGALAAYAHWGLKLF